MGIYKIINVVNNKFYIGSAVNFSRRKTRHFSELRNNKHNNKHLQAAWNMYGELAFVFAIIQSIENKDELLEAENVWLQEHVGKDYCYNIGADATAPMLGKTGELSPTWGRKRKPNELAAQNWIGKTHTIESKQKISNSLKGHVVPTETRLKISASLSGEKNFNYGKPRSQSFVDKVSKAILATNNHGAQVTYPSISALREALGMKPPTINRALKSGNMITRGKYIGWSFKYL